MKARNFLSLIVGLFIVSGMYAKNPATTTYTNIETTATGSIKELTTFSTESNDPLQRSIYKYDLSGNVLEKVVYTWNQDKGWVGFQKLEYTYNEVNTDKPASLTYAKWDNKAGDWSKDVKVVSYKYDANGKATITTEKK